MTSHTVSNNYRETHTNISIPTEAYVWLMKKAGEIQSDEGRKIAVGDVVLDVIRAVDDYDAEKR